MGKIEEKTGEMKLGGGLWITILLAYQGTNLGDKKGPPPQLARSTDR